MNVRRLVGWTLAASILTISAAVVSLLMGVAGWMELATEFANWGYVDYAWMFEGFSGIVGFTFGWTGGIFLLERRHFRFSIVGMSGVLISGFVTLVVFGIVFGLGGLLSGGFLFGFSTIVLSILGMICASGTKDEFS